MEKAGHEMASGILGRNRRHGRKPEKDPGTIKKETAKANLRQEKASTGSTGSILDLTRTYVVFPHNIKNILFGIARYSGYFFFGIV